MTTITEQHKQHSTTSPTRIAIIGGGISGLSAAWYLQQHEDTSQIKYTVLEQSDRWGGKIRTETVEGYGDKPFVIEAGPDSFLTQKPWALQLAIELGIESQLLGTNDEIRKVFVINKGKLKPLPDGVLLIVPTRFTPFILSTLISPLGKLRMGLELFLPRKKDDEDESLADFVRRRLGKEALDKLAEPLMSGIYNTEAERQSLLATFPRFRAMEKKYGSLTRGMLTARKQRANTPPSKYSTFTSFKNGMCELVDALLEKLAGDLRLNTGVEKINQNTNGAYTLDLASGETIEADAIIMSTPAYITADLLRPLAPKTADILSTVRYVSTGTISLAFRRSDIKHPLNGFGLVIPRSEKRPINAVTWSSQKFNYRAPEDYVLMRAFFGGSRSVESMGLDDTELLNMVGQQLRELLGIEAQPLFHRIYRWHRANPQYDVGHLDQIDTAEATLPTGVYITGNAYRGIGVPDCVRQAQELVEKVIIEQKSPTSI
jgi:protoporphyrinogen/coproporphyrinogen III oxidase